MVIPERTRQVHKVVVPFFVVKLGVVLASLTALFIGFVGIDYLRVLGQSAENKRLKGQNFKLRQEIQLIRNKVDSMEFSLERVRNYAKKLQMLTGQGETQVRKGGKTPVAAPIFDDVPMDSTRVPASSGSGDGETDADDLHSKLELPKQEPVIESPGLLNQRIERVRLMTVDAESHLSELQDYLFSRRSLAMATPSLLPIPGRISSSFGYRSHPVHGSTRLHRGVDLVAEPGTPVRAPAPGTIIFSGTQHGYGKVVVIDHGFGIRTLFAHNSKLFVERGLKVERGQIISQVGNTGHSTGPHLHYEVRKNGVAVNPVPFFSAASY